MLFVHELHEVIGTQEDAFEAAVRERYLPALAHDDDARLLYYLKHVFGTGPSYHVVTITAVRDGAAWGRLADRVERGDLRDVAVALDGLRHDVTAKVLRALPWSPLQSLDLAEVPTDAADHELSLFMEDTVWPYEGQLEDYVAAAGAHYAEEMAERGREGTAMLRIEGAFRTAWAAGLRREIVLWQRLTSDQGLLGLLTREIPSKYKRPGLWMVDALALRDRWQSRLLRTAAWSPLY